MPKNKSSNLFADFAKSVSNIMGGSWCFIIASLFILGWGLLGYYFNFSDSWQLVINTITSIITFLMVFIIQNTQNRDTKIIKLKLNELITALKKADNKSIHFEEFTDAELKQMEEHFRKLDT